MAKEFNLLDVAREATSHKFTYSVVYKWAVDFAQKCPTAYIERGPKSKDATIIPAFKEFIERKASGHKPRGPRKPKAVEPVGKGITLNQAIDNLKESIQVLRSMEYEVECSITPKSKPMTL